MTACSKWVHRECLDKWRTVREDKAFSKCTECLTPYTILPKFVNSEAASRKRLLVYSCEIFRDVVIAFSFSQLFIGTFAMMTYALDQRAHVLVNLFIATQHLYLFYYLFGVFLFFAAIGIFSFISLCSDGNSHDGLFTFIHRTDHCCLCRPMFIDPNCGVCCFETNCCMNCSECNCLACGAIEGSAECLPAFLIVLAVFAVLGIFVACFAGMAYVSRTTARHLEILQKRGLASDFIVADLEGDGGQGQRDIEHGYALVQTNESAINSSDQRMLHRLGLM
jgi:hypothetical protein